MSEESGVADEVLEDVSRAVSSRYLDYAVATIMHRAIPDARDGLKPVHRRIINAMRELKLSPTGAFRKSAKIAGDVMGNYHPHGDSAIYDAMVRMAQPFSMRYPLVDGQGNFGNVDGDSAAASRYTEARMEARTEEMLDGVTENAVDFRPNYDGTRSEPTVLPAAFPNLLVNGASGIAVGMATNVPPHNLTETLNAAIAMIADPVADPLSVIRAPDFPTGGVIAESEETIRAVMSSGKGALRLRSAWEVEEDASGRRVVVTEIPYQVRKSALIERLALLIEEKRLPALADVRDESDENVRIVLEPRSRSVDPAEMMEALFSMSDLEVRFQVNMTALEDGVTPRVCGARRLLEIWIRHRVDVVRRVSENRLAKALTRAAMVDAVLKAIGALDAVIAIVRGSDDPETEIMALLGITREQAETVLGIRLRSLRKLDERVLLNERDELARRAAELRGILEGEATLLAEVGRQATILRDAAVAAGDARRTVVSGEPAARVSAGEIRAMSVTREPITVDVSAGGWVRAARGHVDHIALKRRDGDEPGVGFYAESVDRVMLFSSDGTVFSLDASRLPGARGFGEPLRMMIDQDPGSVIVGGGAFREGDTWLMATADGAGLLVRAQDALSSTRKGKRIMTIGDGQRVAWATRVPSPEHLVLTLTNDGRALSFPASEIPAVARGKGFALRRGAGISAITALSVVAPGAKAILPDGTGVAAADFAGKRGGAGARPPVPMSPEDLNSFG